jgi:hypothetical protein
MNIALGCVEMLVSMKYEWVDLDSLFQEKVFTPSQSMVGPEYCFGVTVMHSECF